MEYNQWATKNNIPCENSIEDIYSSFLTNDEMNDNKKPIERLFLITKKLMEKG